MRTILVLLPIIFLSIIEKGFLYAESKSEVIEESTIIEESNSSEELSPEEQVEQWDEQQRQIAEEADQEVRSGNTKRLTYQELRELGVPKSVAESLTKPKPKPATVEDIYIRVLNDKDTPREVKNIIKAEIEKLPYEQRIRIQSKLKEQFPTGFDNPSYTGFIYLGALILLVVYYINRYSKRRVG